jgi:predicted phage baseplate assembly protein
VEKAVTLDDIERHALATPGVPVARVRAVANQDPHLPCYPAPGAITLLVIPPCPRPRPMPSRALLDAVVRYLERRRLVTTEIRAVAPRYRRVTVRAMLHPECDADPGQIRTDALERLTRFLDPLDGGPDGHGWPFGRTVFRTEVLALLAGTPGVSRVTDLTLESGCGSGGCDNVDLCSDELVASGRHRLDVDAAGSGRLRRSTPHECERD